MHRARPSRFLNRLHIPREILGISADIVAIASAILIAGPTLVGVVAGQLAPALVSALALALMVIVYLASRLRRARDENLRGSVALNVARSDARALRLDSVVMHVKLEGLMRFGELHYAYVREANSRLGKVGEVLLSATGGEPSLDAVPVGGGSPPTDEPNSIWQPDAQNPGTFAMEPHHFEVLLADARHRAIEEIGDDAYVRLLRVLFRLDSAGSALRLPIVKFEATSETSQKRTSVDYFGSIDRVDVSTLPWRVAPRPNASPPQAWVLDPSYLKLVHDSWRRVNRPFFGIGLLLARESPLLAELSSPWMAAYVALAGPQASEGNLFSMSNGKLRLIT
jgi:hypothetical protein